MITLLNRQRLILFTFCPNQDGGLYRDYQWSISMKRKRVTQISVRHKDGGKSDFLWITVNHKSPDFTSKRKHVMDWYITYYRDKLDKL